MDEVDTVSAYNIHVSAVINTQVVKQDSGLQLFQEDG